MNRRFLAALIIASAVAIGAAWIVPEACIAHSSVNTTSSSTPQKHKKKKKKRLTEPGGTWVG